MIRRFHGEILGFCLSALAAAYGISQQEVAHEPQRIFPQIAGESVCPNGNGTNPDLVLWLKSLDSDPRARFDSLVKLANDCPDIIPNLSRTWPETIIDIFPSLAPAEEQHAEQILREIANKGGKILFFHRAEYLIPRGRINKNDPAFDSGSTLSGLQELIGEFKESVQILDNSGKSPEEKERARIINSSVLIRLQSLQAEIFVYQGQKDEALRLLKSLQRNLQELIQNPAVSLISDLSIAEYYASLGAATTDLFDRFAFLWLAAELEKPHSGTLWHDNRIQAQLSQLSRDLKIDLSDPLSSYEGWSKEARQALEYRFPSIQYFSHPKHVSQVFTELSFLRDSNRRFDPKNFPNVKLVYLWATWCAPCRQKIPLVNELAKKFPEKVLTINFDASENDPHPNPEVILRYLNDLGAGSLADTTLMGDLDDVPLSIPILWILEIVEGEVFMRGVARILNEQDLSAALTP